ncbi:hypothetical protein [Sphingomonas sp.]|uniref:hypothetical protein n=1 Tax=Sphingomonas sp. TaxID=28214 RepID=UPI003B0024D7
MPILPPTLRSAPALAGLLLALAACNTKPTTITADEVPDDQKAALANAKPVELPPAILATKTYRCADSSVIYVDWFSGDKSANIRTAKGGEPTAVKSDEAGKTMTADGGFALDGSSTASTIKATVPGKKAQSCNA